MAATQVVTAIGNVTWTTDKVQFTTTLSNVTFQVYAVQLTYIQANGVPTNAAMSTSVGNLYANAIALPGNSSQEYYVGAGNQLNILTGAGGFTAVAIGSATSATAGVTGAS
jgi:hypothetical protein